MWTCMRSSNRSDCPAPRTRAGHHESSHGSKATASRLSAASDKHLDFVERSVTTPRGETMIHDLFRRHLTAAAAVAALGTCASAFAFTPPAFPRIAGVQYGSPFNYNDPTYQAQIEKQAITILQYWPGMTAGNESMQSVVQAIKAANPNELVFLYTLSDEGWTSGDNSVARAAETAQLNSMQWWLYSSKSFDERECRRLLLRRRRVHDQQYALHAEGRAGRRLDRLADQVVRQHFLRPGAQHRRPVHGQRVHRAESRR